MAREVKHTYEFGPFRLDATERVLLRSGRLVPLTPKVFDLLLALVENAGRILGKEDLMNRVWADSFVEEGNLTVTISNLRRTLGGYRNGHSYIETVPRRGYRFVARVKDSSNNGQHAEAPPPQIEGVAVKSADSRAIAVLPFKAIGAESADEYIRLGLADALITRLSNIKQLAVRPTTAVRKYAEAHDPVVIGRELHVATVLDGSVQRAGDRIRVTVQLINTRDGASLWAAKFDEQFTNIFALEDSLSEQVTKALTVKLTGEERRLLSKHGTESSEAYLAYLKGLYFFGRRAAEEFKKAVDCFEQAIAADPFYARAYSGLADCYNLLGAYRALPRDYCMRRAKQAALRALELDDTLAEAHSSLAHIKMVYEWDWSGAEAGFKRAIELNPNCSAAHHWYSVTLRLMGRFDQACEKARRALELDPLSLIVNASFGISFYFIKEYDRALKQLSATIELDPNFGVAHFYMGMVLEGKQMYEEAVSEYKKALSLIGRNGEVLAYVGHAYAMSGRVSEARAVLDELERLQPDSSAPYYFVALIYAAMGEKDEAFRYLWLGYEQHSEEVALIKMDPMMQSLRDDPRFASLVKSIGL